VSVVRGSGVGRWREGDRRLLDRSSAPRRVANRTAPERVAVIAKLRQLRMTAAEIAETLGMPLSTVAGILTRLGLGRLGRIGLEQPVRYERSRPGELIHIDVKKLGRIRGVGHRISGSRESQTKTRRLGRLRELHGWEFVHIADDDYSRPPTPKCWTMRRPRQRPASSVAPLPSTAATGSRSSGF
jgi:hypothetical protein